MDRKMIQQKLLEVLENMNTKALEMTMKGVAVACVLPVGGTIDWIGEMKVVEAPFNAEGGDRGWNLIAIAWSKAGEVIASERNSGDPGRKCMMGELNFVGGAYDEYKGYKLAFSFSGGTSEDDLLVAQYGINKFKELIDNVE